MSADGARPLVVVGAGGGCGTSLLALGLALASGRRPARTRLVDLAVGGDLAGGMGVPPDRTVSDLRPVIDELAEDHLDSIALPHRSGVELLAGSPRDEWDADATTRLVAAASRSAAVVVDVGCGASVRLRGAVDAGAVVVMVAPPTIAGARRASIAAASAGPDMAVVVGVTPGRSELGARSFARTSRLRVIGSIPACAGEACELTAGRWPTGRRSRLARALTSIADGIAA